MSLCNMTFRTFSLTPMHEFASNFMWMFLLWSPTMYDKTLSLPLFFME